LGHAVALIETLAQLIQSLQDFCAKALLGGWRLPFSAKVLGLEDAAFHFRQNTILVLARSRAVTIPKPNVSHTFIRQWESLVSMPGYDKASREPRRRSLPTE